jgi:hypothetical protein
MHSRSARTVWITAPIILSLAFMACDRSGPIEANPASSIQASRVARTTSVLASATGAGNTIVSGDLRTFSFSARLFRDGTASGTAEINNRMIDEMFQVDVDCFEVFGNIAVMSGVITRHTDATAIGLTGIFGVIDNGEGTNAPVDAVTQVFFFQPHTATCRDATPDLVVELAAPIVSGNVQVR